MININQNSMIEKEKDIQEIMFNIANKELEKKKVEN